MGLIDLIFPRECLECGKEGKYLCQTCLAKVPPGGWKDKTTYSLWQYKGVIRKAIIALKYKYATEIADELANCALNVLKSSHLASSNYALVPIPLHWYRQNFRGFNQAEILGAKIAREMGWKFIPGLIIRKKLTRPQVQLKGQARRKNVQGVFTVNSNYVLSTLYSVLLFDDVFTTGSTLKEAAMTLNETGAKRVWGLTLAR